MPDKYSRQSRIFRDLEIQDVCRVAIDDEGVRMDFCRVIHDHERRSLLVIENLIVAMRSALHIVSYLLVGRIRAGD